MAITDHGHMNAFATAWKYYDSLKKEGRDFKFVPGNEMYIHPSLSDWESLKEQIQKDKEKSKQIDDQEKTTTVEDENASKRIFNPLNRRHHLVVLPKNSQGLKDLFKLTSYGYTDGMYRFPRIDHFIVQQINKNKNLVAMSACLAGQPSFEMFQECLDIPWDDIDVEIVKSREHLIMPKLRNIVDEYVESFGMENYFLELQFNKLKPQHAINYLLTKLSKETGVKLVATADSHYPGKEKWKAREMYKRIRPGNWTGDDDMPQSVEDLKCELYPKNADQMWEEYLKYKPDYDFYDDEIVCDAIERSHEIAHDLIGKIDPDTKMKLPSFVVPKGEEPIEALRRMAFEGLNKKGLNKTDYVARLENELDVIGRKDFATYFLTMKTMLDLLSQHMIIGPGRGSSSGSLLCYCLDITKIDPIKSNLIFERFLNESRKDLPDIDCDVSDKDKAFKILQKEFGEDNIIAISNVNTLNFKSLVKDLSKFHNIEFFESNAAVKNVDLDIKKAQKLNSDEEIKLTFENAKKHSLAFAEFIEKYPIIEEHIGDLLGEQKSMGRHAGGVLIAESIPEQMPVIVSKSTRQTPWNKKYLEDFGWVKFDLLGLQTLKIIESCISLILKKNGNPNPKFKDIKKWYDEHLDLNVLDLDDQHVYEHVYANQSYAGVFQTTNRATQKFFSEAQPKSINDISDLTAIYRPGTMSVGAHWKYVKRKKGEEKVSYRHELEKEFLEESEGIMIFQEQMMKMVNKIGDLSLVETDTFRKVVSKKPKLGEPLYDEMLKYKDQFIEGATKKGIDKITSKDIWDSIEAFAGYAFNKSHSMAYGTISYVTAWLLTYYEPEWLCAYIETQITNPAEKAIAISEIKSFDYDIAKIDINSASNSWITVPGKKELMPSFISCKGVGKVAVSEIVSNRPYLSIYDMLWNKDATWKHSKFNKTNATALVKIGAFESLDCVGEGKLFSNYAHMYRTLFDEKNWVLLRKKLKRDTFDTQMQKLDDLAAETDDTDWVLNEKIEFTKQLLGQMDLDLIIKKKTQKKLFDRGYVSINDFPDDVESALTWFVLEEKEQKRTKYQNKYFLLHASGLSGVVEKIYLWECGDSFDMEKNRAYVALIDKNDFGFATKARFVNLIR